MYKHPDELGIIDAVLDELQQHTLPRALDLRRKVDAGEPLEELDLIFLEEVMERLREAGRYAQHHPDWEPLYSRLIDLYHHITSKGLENAQRDASAPRR